jgi:hypothetical protein
MLGLRRLRKNHHPEPVTKGATMGQHSTPTNGKSSYGRKNYTPQSKGYTPKHGAAGSDLPPRGKGITYDNTKKEGK